VTATGKAAEAKAKWKVNLFPFVLETQGFLHARGRLLLCKIARLQTEHADERRRAAKYPSYASLGVRTRRLIERVYATLQFGSSTLMLRYLQDCLPAFNEVADGWHPCSVFVARAVGISPIPAKDRTLSTPKRRHSHDVARPVADCMTRIISCTACACPLTITNVDH